MLRASIIGGSGYVGGELLRLLLVHPQIELAQVISERLAGKPVTITHPNLRRVRGVEGLQYAPIGKLAPCDVLFVALSHGEAARRIDELAQIAPRIVDCSADFRLRDAMTYEQWYGEPHPAPHWLNRFVYGLPELHREEISAAQYVSGVGCNATASILALLPLVQAGLLDVQRDIVIDVKVGSSEGGAQVTESSHHPERSGAVRSFAPVGHRHTAEIMQATGLQQVHLSITSVELVRGVLATAHIFPSEHVTEKDLWRAYRLAYTNEPFVRIVRERQGNVSPARAKNLAGSNYADVGFALDEASGRVVSICALDNLGKGAAGTAVQCMNLMCGFDETMGLEFAGLHPI